VATEPLDQWSVDHLDGAVFGGTFDVGVDLTGPSWADAPACDSVKISGNNKAPPRQ